MTELPWYHSGLKFKCTQCGDCCTGNPGFVWVNKQEIENLAILLKLEVAEFERRYVRQVGIRRSLIEFPNGDCIFFHGESRTCGVYTARPRQCRTWPFWSSNLRNEESWEAAAEHCPGCNKGQVVPLEKIEEQRQTMEL